MSKKVYRSSQGKIVDLGAIQLQNETVRAVGNMGVNARGDIVNPQNKTVNSRTSRIGKQYKKQLTNVVDDYIPVNKHDQPKTLSKAEKRVIKEKDNYQPETITPVVEPEVVPVTEDPTVQSAPISGLADAIARARTVKQEPMKTPRQQAQLKAGVKKI